MVGKSQQPADVPQDGVNIIFDGKSRPLRFETQESFLLRGYDKKEHSMKRHIRAKQKRNRTKYKPSEVEISKRKVIMLP